MSGYRVDAGRTPAQIAKMKRLIASGVCAFCPEHFEEFHDHPIEFQTAHWTVAKNDYPYDHTSLHLLIVAKKHVSTLAQLSKAARADFIEVVVRIERDFNLPSMALAMRMGDFRYTASSVDHLHAHVIVGTRDPNGFEPVRMKLSSLPKE